MTETLRIERFHGGMTDLYVGADSRYGQFYKNLLIDSNGKIYQRPGTDLFVIGNTNSALLPGTGDVNDSIIPWAVGSGYGTYNIMARRGSSLYICRPSVDAITGEITNDPAHGWVVVPQADTNDTSPFVDSQLRLSYFLRSSDHIYFAGNNTKLTAKVYLTSTTARSKLTRIGLQAPIITLDSGATAVGTENYIYHAYYERQYSTISKDYVDRGPTTVLEVTDVRIDFLSGDSVYLDVDYSNIAPSQSVNNFYGVNETAGAIKIYLRIFRTENNEVTPYETFPATGVGSTPDLGNPVLVTDVAAISFRDRYEDGVGHRAQEIVYTASGELDGYPPERGLGFRAPNFITFTSDGVAFYSAGRARVMHSKPDAPDAVPLEFFIDFEKNISGLASIRNYCIAFERYRTTRIEGAVDALGRGSFKKRDISLEVGCISHSSIREVDRLVYFCAKDGIYSTDGFRIDKHSDHLEERYASLTKNLYQTEAIETKYDSVGRRLYFSFNREQLAASSAALTETWVLDLNFPVEDQKAVITEYDYNTTLVVDQINNIGSFPTSNMFLDGTHFKFDNKGYMYRYDSDLTTDRIYDAALTEANFLSRVVTYTWKSAAMHFGHASLRKWVTKAEVFLKNLSPNITLALTSFNNDKQYDPRRMRPVAITGNTDGFHIFKRWFPARTLRCMFKQLQISNQDTIVLAESADSLDLAQAFDVGTDAPSLLRITGVGATPTAWPDNLVGQHIYISADNYQDPYLITNFSNGSDTIRLRDTGLQLPAGDFAWVIRGQNIDEKFKAEAVEIEYALLGESIDAKTGVT